MADEDSPIGRYPELYEKLLIGMTCTIITIPKKDTFKFEIVRSG